MYDSRYPSAKAQEDIEQDFGSASAFHHDDEGRNDDPWDDSRQDSDE